MEMNLIFGLLSLFCILSTGKAISCFRCNSTQTLDCLEKFIHPNPLRAESCSDVFEARYCIKTTGIYNEEIGTQRFCSSKDFGNQCEYVKHHDGREYRSCVYTCSTDGCNSAYTFKPSYLVNIVILLSTMIMMSKYFLASFW